MPDFSPRILPQLRSLTLNEASPLQMCGIRAHYLPHLIHLCVKPLYTETEEEIRLLETLFIGEERFIAYLIALFKRYKIMCFRKLKKYGHMKKLSGVLSRTDFVHF
jgi:hypothetical protein